MALAAALLGVAAGGSAESQSPVEAESERGSWRSADPGYTLVFPRDHAAHPDYRIEWWYYTGNLEAAGGRRFGYQVTFFRAGVDRRPVNPSRWAVRDLHMAHLAVTDVARGEHHVAERLNRAGVGWAGADPETLHVWNDGWSLTLEEGAHRLVAASDDGRLTVDLRLEPAAPPVLHGDGGYSRKGDEPGNASHYYSLTRLPTTGHLTVGGRSFDVAGASWMDHEFGSSFLEPAQAGWDWFSIQLDDGTDLMLYTMRRLDGSADPWSSGTVVTPAAATRLRAGGSSPAGAGLPARARPALDVPRQRRVLSGRLADRRSVARHRARGGGGGRRPGAAHGPLDRGHLLGGDDRRARHPGRGARHRARLPGDDRLRRPAPEPRPAVARRTSALTLGPPGSGSVRGAARIYAAPFG